MKSKKTIWKSLFLCLALAAAWAPAVSLAWWNGDWASREKITLDTTAKGADTKGGLTDVPVLIRLHSGNFNFLDANMDGADLRFVAGDDKTPLKYYIEKFDSLNQLALIWVRVPKLAPNSNANFIWLYYGNDKAVSGGDSKGVFDAHQSAVYNFAGAQGPAKDATANGNNASRSDAGRDAGAVIGSGATFDGAQSILIPASPSLRLAAGGGFTFSAWVKVPSPEANAVIFEQRDGTNGLRVALDQGGVYGRLQSGGAAAQTPKVPLPPGDWHHVALTVDTQGMTLYLDGAPQQTVAAKLSALGGDVTLGAGSGGSGSFKGELDEVELSNAARSADWIGAAARSQGAGAAFALAGQPEQNEGEGGTSYFATILHSVTPDGWVVIVALGIMAAVSWVVMVGKGLVIGRMEKDNARFLSSFQRLASDTGQLDRDEDDPEAADEPEFSKALFGQHDHYQSSPIYRIYHIGVQELKRRFGTADAQQAAGKTLTPQAIDAIRASLDGGLVRENQKLNSLMVLLTIAISGGPFLGLLGTVVGVMITFASIAAAGDVNVNAIAPGIAAALVATVAGLAVAIPALFGYNYLISRIKNITADMHVFVDEFISRVAEDYQS